MDCRCLELDELRSDEAIAYAEQHLARIDSHPGGQWLYRCPDTDVDWLYHFPPDWATGHGGRAHVRRLVFRESL